jgi:hypothetical protein
VSSFSVIRVALQLSSHQKATDESEIPENFSESKMTRSLEAYLRICIRKKVGCIVGYRPDVMNHDLA